MALLADLLLGVATARHHSTESQTTGAEGAAAALTAQLREHGNVNYTVYVPSETLRCVCVCLSVCACSYVTDIS